MDMWFRTEITRLNQAQKASKGKKEQKESLILQLEEYLRMVQTMPAKFWDTNGDELFGIVFKCTFYNHQCVFGGAEAQTPESKVNLAVHTLCTQIMSSPKSEDMGQKMLIVLSELIYTGEKQVSTQRVARIIHFLKLLFQATKHLPTYSKFYPGMLYAVGGLLKVEARNYIDTRKLNEPDFQTASENTVENAEMEKALESSKRELSPSDLTFFNRHFLRYMQDLVVGFRQTVKPLSGERFEFFQSWNQPEFVDTPAYDRSKKTSLFADVEAAHAVCCFTLDFLQYLFQFFITVKPREAQKKGKRSPAAPIEFSEV
jgi:hypothetical protein